MTVGIGLPTIHEAFVSQARTRPDAVALIHGDQRISYAVLDAASDEYAARLGTAGVRAGAVVPVSMAKTERFIAVLLAVLKCGAAYAALDERWPKERIDLVLGQLNARLLINDRDGPGGTSPIWRVGPEDLGQVAAAGGKPLPVTVDADDVSTVFFTSGTTGTPKGVRSPHRATSRLFVDCEFVSTGPGAVMPLAAPVPWDAFSLELWSMLLTGGTCVLIDEPYLVPRSLRDHVARNGVNLAWLTSSVFNLLVDEDITCFAGLRDLLIGGERLSPDHVRRFLERHPEVRLTNGYGPVESCIFASTHRVLLGDCDDPFGIPIGAAVSGTLLHLLTDRRPCEPGEVGELYIEGDGLALGYVTEGNQAAGFIDIVLDGVERRLYRTGDLCRRTAQGVYHYRGRVDRQVKIRGHRVEPAELEQQALGVADVGACRVLPYSGDGVGYDGLVLFASSRSGGAVDENALKRALAEKVPSYLMPSRIIPISPLPLTANGKTDDRALMAIAGACHSQQESETFDGDPSVVGSVFADVLGVQRVPHDVSFFELGGTSLGIGRVCARLNTLLDVAVPLSKVMEIPRVRDLEEWIAENENTASATADIGLMPGESPLVAAQHGFLIAQALNPDDLSGLCLMVWRMDGELDVAALRAALQDIADRHETLSCVYTFDPRLSVRPQRERSPVDFTHKSGVGVPVQAMRDELLAELVRPLDPFAGQLWRSALISDEVGNGYFGTAVHHLAFDAASESILADELSVAYAARIAAAAPRFSSPAPTIDVITTQYGRQVDVSRLDRQRAYWRDILEGAERLTFPAGRRIGRADDRQSAGVDAVVSASVYQACHKIATNAGSTLFSVLLAAYARTLQTLTGQHDFVVGAPFSKRGAAGLDQAIQCLVDVIYLRMRLDEEIDWACAIRRAHTVARSAFSHSDIPVGELVRVVGRNGSVRSPLYQTMFAVQDQQPPQLRLPGCVAHFQRPDAPGAVCEIVTEVVPEADGSARIHVTYQHDRISPDFVSRLASSYHRTVEDLARTGLTSDLRC